MHIGIGGDKLKFEVKSSSGEYKPSHHQYKLIFANGTIWKCIVKNTFRFTEIEPITNGSASTGILIG